MGVVFVAFFSLVLHTKKDQRIPPQHTRPCTSCLRFRCSSALWFIPREVRMQLRLICVVITLWVWSMRRSAQSLNYAAFQNNCDGFTRCSLTLICCETAVLISDDTHKRLRLPSSSGFLFVDLRETNDVRSLSWRTNVESRISHIWLSYFPAFFYNSCTLQQL